MGTSEITIFIISVNLLILVLLGIIVAFVLQYRKQYQAHQHALLEKEYKSRQDTLYQVSRELHDDIGSGLSGVYMLLLHLRQSGQQNFTLEHTASLEKIDSYMNEIIEKVSDFSFLLQSNGDTVEALMARLEKFGATLSRANNIHFTASLNCSVATMYMELVKRKNIYLICKEAINNACKYSKADHLQLHSFIDDDQLVITITDNGCGFELSGNMGRSGLVNMASRATESNAELHIHSLPGTGTTIRLSVSFTGRPV